MDSIGKSMESDLFRSTTHKFNEKNVRFERYEHNIFIFLFPIRLWLIYIYIHGLRRWKQGPYSSDAGRHADSNHVHVGTNTAELYGRRRNRTAQYSVYG